MEEILYKYFKNDMVKYFHSSDAHANIEGDAYLRFRMQAVKVELWIGGESGETCLCVTDNPKSIQNIIEAIINS